MVLLAKKAFGAGGAETFAEAIQAIAHNGDRIKSALVAWVEVIGNLVQAAEQRFPKGHGRLKKEMVKSAAHYLLSKQKTKLPEVPEYLEPLFLDLAVDLSIEFVWRCTDSHGLWDDQEEERPSARAFIAEAMLALEGVVAIVASPLLWLFSAIEDVWQSMRQRAFLTPDLKKTLNQVDLQALIDTKTELIGEVPAALEWVGEHSKQIVSLLDLVFEGIEEAESFIEMGDEDKKRYVTALVIAALQELGLDLGDGLMRILVETFLDGAIDSAVRLFSRFPSQDPAFKPSGPPSPDQERRYKRPRGVRTQRVALRKAPGIP
jgi:hypothetical protein